MSLSVTFLDCLIVLVIIISAGYAAWRGFLDLIRSHRRRRERP